MSQISPKIQAVRFVEAETGGVAPAAFWVIELPARPFAVAVTEALKQAETKQGPIAKRRIGIGGIGFAVVKALSQYAMVIRAITYYVHTVAPTRDHPRADYLVGCLFCHTQKYSAIN